VVKFWKVKGQGRCGRYALYWALLVSNLLSVEVIQLHLLDNWINCDLDRPAGSGETSV